MRNDKFAVSMLLATMLTGCGTTYWFNPDGGSYKIDQAVCELDALQAVPPAIETTQVSSPEDAPTKTICKTGRDGKSSCTTITGAAPIKSVPVDMNEAPRKKAEKLCLYRKGWQEVTAEEYDKLQADKAAKAQAARNAEAEAGREAQARATASARPAQAASKPVTAQTPEEKFLETLFRAQSGDVAAQFKVAVMHELGQGTQKDLPSAITWYQKVADQGDMNGQMKMGYFYQTGIGVPLDYAKAFKLNTLASLQGDNRAQNNLGVMYRAGQGTERDLAEAARWFERAAKQGNPLAQASLGDAYLRAQGVELNVDEAVNWYRKAADQGNQNAKNMLKNLGK